MEPCNQTELNNSPDAFTINRPNVHAYFEYFTVGTRFKVWPVTRPNKKQKKQLQAFGHTNHYKLVYCLLQKIYRQPLKKITYLATRPRFLSLGLGCQGQGLGLQVQGQSEAPWSWKPLAFGCSAEAANLPHSPYFANSLNPRYLWYICQKTEGIIQYYRHLQHRHVQRCHWVYNAGWTVWTIMWKRLAIE